MKSEIGRCHGKRYKLIFDKMCNQLCVVSRYSRWFLWIENDYIGDFRIKKDAYEYMEKYNDIQ